MMEIIVRPMRPSDENFVYDTWLNNFKESSFGRRVNHSIYFEHQRNRISNVLARGGHAVVACSPDDENQLLGFMVYEKQDGQYIVHYIFTKRLYQRMGVAKTLFNSANIQPDNFVFTHLTPVVEQILGAAFGNGAYYNPYRT